MKLNIHRKGRIFRIDLSCFYEKLKKMLVSIIEQYE